jgi:hypothetical protein
MIRPAIPTLLRKQASALESLLNFYCKRRGNVWYVRRRKLNTFARPTPDGDPEQYVSWSIERKLKDTGTAETPMMRDFLDEFYLSGSFAYSRDELRIHWMMMCKFTVHYLINHELPVDCLWFVLHPSPYRSDWIKEIRKQLSHIQRPVRLGRIRLKRLFETTHIRRRMLHGPMLAFDPQRKHIYRRIELEHTPSWWKMIRRVEAARLEKLGPTNYARNIKRSMAAAAPVHRRLYKQHVVEVHCPRASFHPGGDQSLCVLDTIRIDYRNVNRRFVFVGVDPSEYEVETKKRPSIPRKRKVSRENGSVPAVPIIQPEVPDVRDGGREVAGSETSG